MKLSRSLKIFLRILLIFFLLIAITIGSIRLYFSEINTYKPKLEQWISEALNKPVKIKQLQVDWKGLYPKIDLDSIDILDDKTQSPWLHVQRLQVDFNILQTLLQRHVVLSNALIAGVDLKIHRLDQKTFEINGIKLLLAAHTDDENIGKSINPLLNQGKFKLKNINLDWQDGKQQPIRLTQLNMTLSNMQFSSGEGHAKIRGAIAQLKVPAWFNHSFEINKYQGEIAWAKKEDVYHIQAENLILSDPYVTMYAQLNLQLPQDDTPYVQMTATFSEKDSSHLRDYVPTGILTQHQALSTWLTEAFVSGDGVTGQLLLEGPLSHFPFDDHSGRFEAVAHVQDMLFNYKTGWPSIAHLNATAIFKGRHLDITAKPGATILNATAGDIKASIPDLGHADLAVQGLVQSDMQEGLRFIAQSPLQKTIGEGLDNLLLHGPMDLNLGLHIPLYKDGPATTVKGDVLVKDQQGNVSVPAWKVQLTDFGGAFTFTENGFFASKLAAKWLGHPVDIHVDTNKVAADKHLIQATLKGYTTVADLQKAYGLDALKDKMSGGANYTVLLTLNRQNEHTKIKLGLDSDLQGIAINFPGPVQKSIAEKIPVHVETRLLEKTALNLWLSYAQKFTADMALAQDLHKAWFLKTAKVHFSKDPITIFGMPFAAADVEVASEFKQWGIDINGPEMAGWLILPVDASQPIEGDFQYVHLKTGASKIVSDINPGDIPPLDLHFDDFDYENRSFGEVSLRTLAEKNQLRIDRLKIKLPHTTLFARGQWQAIGKRHQTTLSGNLRSDDIGDTLQSWKVTSSVVGGKGGTAFALSWPAAAYDFSFQQLNGSFSLAFDKGSIINIGNDKTAEMGIGRILNLLSLQSIPRRLTLDFSDLLQKGFVFDVMKGEFEMHNGNAVTENAYLNGPIAKVEINGRIGMADKDYDLIMTTEPYITSSLPLAATIVGGPIVGAATWLGNKVLGGVVNHMVTHTYKITGPWDKPLVETLAASKL